MQIEGLSARYVPIMLTVPDDWRITVRPSGRTIRAWAVPIDGDLDAGIELEADGDDLIAELPPTAGELARWFETTEALVREIRRAEQGRRTSSPEEGRE